MTRSTAAGGAEEISAFDWLEEFVARKGRPLRVLHIGNIANNAYNNAQIQRRYGIEADVLSIEYYHVMATPEWEDGGLDEPIDDAFFPDWWATGLEGLRRPPWFVSGPLDQAIAYLRARHENDEALSRRLALGLQFHYWNLVELAAANRGSKRKISAAVRARSLSQFRNGMTFLEYAWLNARASYVSARIRLTDFCRGAVIRSRENQRPSFVDRLITHQLPRYLPLLASEWSNMPVRELRSQFSGRDYSEPQQRMRQALELSGLVLSGALSIGYLRAVRFCSSCVALAGRFTKTDVARERRPLGARDLEDRRERALASCLETYETEQRHLPSGKLRTDIAGLRKNASPLWTQFLAHYDVVQGYSIEGIFPLLQGIKAFASYEHGTLRDLPFQEDRLGRLCNFVYRKSPVVFVTNTDVLPSATRLGIPPERIVCLPHAFDNTKLRSFAAQKGKVRPSRDGGPVFFCPTRHHWKYGDGSWLKGNDRLLRAAAILHQKGHAFRLVLTRWGKEVDLSEALIEELGCGDVISWVNPVGKQGLWQRYLDADAVLDQFVLPAIGGVAFEALTLGRRLITAMDAEVMTEFFGKAPPILAAQSVDEIAERMRAVIADPADEAELGAAGTQWIEDYHSARRTVQLQLNAYSRLLNASERMPAA